MQKIINQAMKKTFNFTADGLNELKAELNELIGQRPAIAERIKQTRELGDLSENAEYQSTREEQDRLESRISELENVLNNSKIIRKPKTDGQVVLGSTVRLKSASGKTPQFQVVGTMEADPLRGKISDESPIGAELMGKQVGDKVTIANSEATTYKITHIS